MVEVDYLGGIGTLIEEALVSYGTVLRYESIVVIS